MVDTVNITITPLNTWVEVTQAVAAGFITSTKSIQYCQSATPPPETFIGHHLVTMQSFRYELSGSSLYIKATEPTVLVLTED